MLSSYWHCEKRDKCPGRLTQKADQNPMFTASYNHEPDENKNKQEIFITNLKRQIREDPMPIGKIFRSELINRYTNEPDAVCTLPEFYQIKNSLYRTKNENCPPLPKSIEQVTIEVNRKWRLSLRGEDFTMIDNNSLRYLAFDTLESLKMLCSCERIFADGTFRSSPKPFTQLYSIHIESSMLNGTIPVIYSLLPNKFKNTYLGWKEQYYASAKDDPISIKALYQQTCALAFIPTSSIDDIWCNITDAFDNLPGVQVFFDYVTDTWVDNDSLYPRKL
ncbi:unnamed protein product [Rotaria magnacalcarata]|uniref:MULE transposase domain-containing protein n=1 Tax=Rotaria magnacalcarata TaxID=392030 RepID=A0A819ZIV7_9BILA|nr:unnamed protein product [Rotaria magnacalcarata]CAF4173224.1 unnamed protein product [Rotaria magnacalcarata]